MSLAGYTEDGDIFLKGDVDFFVLFDHSFYIAGPYWFLYYEIYDSRTDTLMGELHRGTGNVYYGTVPIRHEGTYYYAYLYQEFYDVAADLKRWQSIELYIGEPPTAPGGCPVLFVWTDEGYVREALLEMHGDSDITLETSMTNNPEFVDGKYVVFTLAELGIGYNQSHSYIDYAGLHIVDGNGRSHKAPLVSANHSDYGNVKQLLLRSDDNRVDLSKSDLLILKFATPSPHDHIQEWIFLVEGHNPGKVY